MIPDEFRNFVRRKPFRPFRITLTDGRTYDIPHPEMAVVGYASVMIGTPLKDQDNADDEHDILVSLLHVMQIESINPGSTGTKLSNGKT